MDLENLLTGNVSFQDGTRAIVCCVLRERMAVCPKNGGPSENGCAKRVCILAVPTATVCSAFPLSLERTVIKQISVGHFSGLACDVTPVVSGGQPSERGSNETLGKTCKGLSVIRGVGEENLPTVIVTAT